MISLQGPRNLIFSWFLISWYNYVEHELKFLWVFHFVPETGPLKMTKVSTPPENYQQYDI